VSALDSNDVVSPVLRVAFLWAPASFKWRLTGANPYAGLLANALSKHAIRVDARSDHSLRFVWQVPRAYDVMHLNWIPRLYEHSNPIIASLRLLGFVALLLLARLRGIRIVWTMHNVMPHEQLRPVHGLIARRVLTRLAHTIICHCEHAREILASRFGRTKQVLVIPHGSFADAYPRKATRAESRRAFDIPESAFVYGYFGNIRAYKGVEQLLEDFGSIEDGNVRLLIAGALHANYDGPLHSMTIDDERVITHFRHIADEEIQLVMGAVDVLVLPFLDTLTSGSAVLALGHETPIIVPRHGCLPELIGSSEAAIFYDPDQPGALREALSAARGTDHAAARIAARARDSRLGWDTIAHKTLTAYGHTPEGQHD
jgi:beta-1,4-mannosyltransferase